MCPVTSHWPSSLGVSRAAVHSLGQRVVAVPGGQLSTTVRLPVGNGCTRRDRSVTVSTLQSPATELTAAHSATRQHHDCAFPTPTHPCPPTPTHPLPRVWTVVPVSAAPPRDMGHCPVQYPCRPVQSLVWAGRYPYPISQLGSASPPVVSLSPSH